MIVGVGCDIVEHEVSKSLNWDSDISILRRIFSEEEINIYYANNDLKFLSGRFAAKEAVLKSLGMGMQDEIALPAIQILETREGSPVIRLSGKVKEVSDEKCVSSWNVSITHSTNYSLAFVIAEK